MGLTALIPLEMIHCEHYDSEVDLVWPESEVEIDPADYPGLVNAYFEVVGESDDVSVWQLVDGAGTVYASNTLICNALLDTLTRHRSAAFSLNPAKTKYYLKMVAYGGGGYCYSNGRIARILLEVVDSAKVRIEIPLIESDQSAPGCTGIDEGSPGYDYFCAWAYDNYASDGGYHHWWNQTLQDRPNSTTLFKKDENKWSAIDHWSFEVVLGCMEVESVYAALFNKTTGQMVAGTELSIAQNESPLTADTVAGIGWAATGCMPIRKTVDFANNAANFTNGDEFEVLVKLGAATNSNHMGLIYSAKLYCTVVNATAAQVYWRCGSTVAGTYGTESQYDSYVRTLYEPDKFPEGTPIYLETTATGESANASVFLHDMQTMDQGAASILVRANNSRIISGPWLPLTLPSTAFNWYEGGDYTDGSSAYMQNLSVPGTYTVQADEFDLSVIPDGLTIQQVRLFAVVANTGQTIRWDLGSRAFFNPESMVLDDGTIVMNGFTVTYGTGTIPSSVQLSCVQPNATPTTMIVTQISILVGVNEDVALSELNPTVTRTRLRSEDISSELVADHRYIMHFDIPTSGDEVGHAQSFLIYDVEGEESEEEVEERTGDRIIEYFTPQELFHQIEDAFFVHCGLTWDGGDAVEITGITNANPAVVTAPGHALENGDYVRISDVLGMTEINNTDESSAYIVAGVSGDTFQLSGVDSTDFGVFAGGSTVEKVTNHVIGLITSIYYAGRTIRALGDGEYEYNGDLTEDGEVTFPWYANKIHVGLPFSTVIEPMNPNAGSQQGTARTKKQKINRAGLCFYETVHCKVGINETLAYELPAIDSDAAATGVPHFVKGELLSDDLTVDLRGEWEDKATIYIEHDHATPFTLKAVIPRQNTDDES